MADISQYMQMLNHYIVYLRLTFLFYPIKRVSSDEQFTCLLNICLQLKQIHLFVHDSCNIVIVSYGYSCERAEGYPVTYTCKVWGISLLLNILHLFFNRRDPLMLYRLSFRKWSKSSFFQQFYFQHLLLLYHKLLNDSTIPLMHVQFSLPSCQYI